MQTFVEAKNRKESEQRISHHVSKLVKVEGGYLGFEYITDYEVWRRAR